MIFLLYPSKEEQRKILARERAKAWRLANPERYKSNQDKWHELNKDTKKARNHEYYIKNKEKIKSKTKLYQKTSEKYKQYKKLAGELWRRDNPQYLKEYYKNNKTKLNKRNREYYLNNKEFVSKVNSNWRNAHQDIVRSIKRKYKKTYKGKITTAKHYDKRRYMGSILLNNWFVGCNRHHINKDYIICIPKEIHILYHHDHKKPETMTLINIRAFEYLMS